MIWAMRLIFGVFIGLIFALFRYSEKNTINEDKDTNTTNLLWVIMLTTVLIPCNIFTILNKDTYFICIGLGINLILGICIGVFLKKLIDKT